VNILKLERLAEQFGIIAIAAIAPGRDVGKAFVVTSASPSGV